MKFFLRALPFFLTFLFLGMEPKGFTETSPHVAELRGISHAFSQAAEKAAPAVVFIKVSKQIPQRRGERHHFNDPYDLFNEEFLRRFFGYRQEAEPRQQPDQYHPTGQGSGFLISPDGYILTNNHVVGGADLLTVTLSDGREFEAEMVGSDPHTDVAVIKLEEEGEEFPYVELGDSHDLSIGEWVIAVGNPFGLSSTVTAGIVSAKGRNSMGITEYEDFIQTDAAINPGNSGGPLLNLEGRVVGINTAIFSKSGGYMGIGFAIPIHMAKRIHDQLLETGKVVRGFLGISIQDVTKDIAESFGREEAGGILVAEVQDPSPAHEAGLRQGDIILEMNGDKVKDSTSFRNKIAFLSPGTRIEIRVLREGQLEELNIKVGTFPNDAEGGMAEEELWQKLGFQAEDISPEWEQKFRLSSRDQGIVVTQVLKGSEAFRFGIRPGTLILGVSQTRIENLKEFKKEIKKVEDKVLLLVKKGAHVRYIVLKFSKGD